MCLAEHFLARQVDLARLMTQHISDEEQTVFKILSRFFLFALIAAAGVALVQAQSPAPAAKAKPAVTAIATFAGGCFWCMEGPFDALDGVISTTSGYTGGTRKNPTYEQVSSGYTGHAESVQVVYDPAKVSYEKLLDVFWHNIDPTVANRQFCDSGSQYRTAIFYQDDAQKKAADASKAALAKSKPFNAAIVTEITAATEFFPAEDYHQDYYIKNPVRYRFYRQGCGRDARLKELWGDKAGH
jgi:peptide-methionine (S)-S-oxide reductase